MEKGKKDKIFLDINYSELSLTCASGTPAIDSGISEFKGIGKKKKVYKDVNKLNDDVNQIEKWGKEEGKDIIKKEWGK